MRRIVTTAVITTLLALALVSAASARVPNGVQNWQNMDAGLQPRTTWISNSPFRLKSLFNNQLLGYGSRTFGPDLQWGDHGDWIIKVKPGSGASVRPVTQSDHVALYNTQSGKYLGYGTNDSGVDLTWSTNPSFEWQLAGTGKNRGLYSAVHHDYLEYGPRTFGINLKWQYHEVADQDYVEPPDYELAPSGPQIAYVTLARTTSPSAMKERYTGRLGFQVYHQAVVDQLQNTSQYPISFVAWRYPAPDHCSGMVWRQGQILQGQQLADMTRDQQGPRQQYDIKSCGAVGGTGNGTSPLVRVVFHYVS